jgi:hypothetical protein
LTSGFLANTGIRDTASAPKRLADLLRQPTQHAISRKATTRKKQDDAIAADVAANYLGGAEAARASIQSNNKGGPVETGHREFAGTRLAVQAATLDLPPAKRYPALRERKIWLPGERDGATTTRD